MTNQPTDLLFISINRRGDTLEFKIINQAPVSIGTELNQFINDIDSLADTLPNTLAVIQAVQATASQELLKFGNKNIGIQETSGGKVVLKASLDIDV